MLDATGVMTALFQPFYPVFVTASAILGVALWVKYREFGSLVIASIGLIVSTVIKFQPDWADKFILLLVVMVISYVAAWIGQKIFAFVR